MVYEEVGGKDTGYGPIHTEAVETYFSEHYKHVLPSYRGCSLYHAAVEKTESSGASRN